MQRDYLGPNGQKSSPARRTAGPLDVRTTGGIRTHNLSLVIRVLYPLSYSSTPEESRRFMTFHNGRGLALWIVEEC